MTAGKSLSATGEPVFFRCDDVLRFCRSGIAHLGDGYFVRPGIRLLYQFNTRDRPEADWREADAQFRAVVDDILIAGAPGSRP